MAFKSIVFSLSILTLISCNKEKLEVSFSKEQVDKEYPRILEAVNNKRTGYQPDFYPNKKERLTKAQIYIEHALSEDVLPIWIGTEWDYNGTTTTPQKGKIACGYFVTTTLNQIGFKFNRSILAQQASLFILKSFCKEENIKRIGHNNTKALFQYLDQENANIYLCGLDNHVGYIIKDNNTWYAFHASGLSPYQVVKEPLQECPAYLQSQNFFVAPLFKDGYMLSSWILGVPVEIYTS